MKMTGYVVQLALVFILTFLNVNAKKPPGYVAPPKEYDPNPPKYEYGYRIQTDKATQGKDEQRDGIYAQGRYYVENGTESSQNVKYFADDWGYHPVVEYSNEGPHSKSSTNFVLGEEAIKLKNNQKSIPQDPSDPGKAENLAKINPSIQDPSMLHYPDSLNVHLIVTQENPTQEPVDPNTQQTHTLLPNQPQLILQNDPQLQTLTSQPDQQQLQNRQLIEDPNLQPDYNNNAPKQPIFYYVQPQQESNIQQPDPTSSQTRIIQPQKELQLEVLPQPQALISDDKDYQIITNNGVNDNEQKLETSALFAPEYEYKEFGARLNAKSNHKKLIESTKNLVSGEDVLDINAAAAPQEQSSNDEIETSTLENLLHQYVTPTLITTNHDVDTNLINIVSSTTPATPSLFREPIIVAESESEAESKPVTEKTDENKDYPTSTARSTLAAKESTESSSDHVLVTPRPVSSKFLAPITAGVQLQHVDEQIFDESQAVKSQQRQEKVLVQVQNTIPYYLGMYQYPLGYDMIKNASEHKTFAEQQAITDIELGKTLLYFPGEESHKVDQPQRLIDVESNQLPTESKTEANLILAQQDNVASSNQEISDSIEKAIHVPIGVTKLIDRPFPVPYPQPYSLEKVVQKVVKEPYLVPVENGIERKIPVPYYIERPVEKIVEKERKIPIPYYVDKPVTVQEQANSQAFLLQIPGLFSHQKYSSLVQNSLQTPNFNALLENSQYLPLKQNNQGRSPQKLKKLNLLVFPRINIANLPPITRNAHDLYRYSNAQLNNAYLPPIPQHNSQSEASASNINAYSMKKPEEHLGLIPPKRPLFDDYRKQRTARAYFDDKSVRLEYGFMPPLIPSLEIDEQGQPIEKDDN